MTPWFGLVFLIALPIFFYKAAEFENLRLPIVWAAGSALLYLGAVYGLHWGLIGALLLQAGLFACLAAWINFFPSE